MTELSYVTAGESHGPALTAVVSGLPTGLVIERAALDAQLARRQAGYGRSARQRIETDRAIVTGGLRHGRTLGGPVALQIENRDHTRTWNAAMSVWPTDEVENTWRDTDPTVPRPGHADLGGMARSGADELRTILERSSARETAARVAAGWFAQTLLATLGIEVRGYVRGIGAVTSGAATPAGIADPTWERIDESQFRCLDVTVEDALLAEVDSAKTDRDTLGGLIEVVAYGVPPGIGGYATSAERLSGRLAGAVMSVQAMKGVEVGDGFALAGIRGSAAHDEMDVATGADAQGMGVTRPSNRAGGIEGGMANGAPIVIRVAMKPLPTLMRPLRSVDLATGEPTVAHAERSDVCAVPAAAIVLESVVAFELARVVREQFGMQSLTDMHVAWDAYCERVGFASTSVTERA